MTHAQIPEEGAAAAQDPAIAFAAPSDPGFGAAVPVTGIAPDSAARVPAEPAYIPEQPSIGGVPAAPAPATIPAAATAPPGPHAQYPGAGYAPALPADAGTTAAFILGLIGVVGGIVFGWTLPLSILAVILAARGLSRDPASARARTARTLGLIGILLSALWMVYSIIRIFGLILG